MRPHSTLTLPPIELFHPPLPTSLHLLAPQHASGGCSANRAPKAAPEGVSGAALRFGAGSSETSAGSSPIASGIGERLVPSLRAGCSSEMTCPAGSGPEVTC